MDRSTISRRDLLAAVSAGTALSLSGCSFLGKERVDGVEELASKISSVDIRPQDNSQLEVKYNFEGIATNSIPAGDELSGLIHSPCISTWNVDTSGNGIVYRSRDGVQKEPGTGRLEDMKWNFIPPITIGGDYRDQVNVSSTSLLLNGLAGIGDSPESEDVAVQYPEALEALYPQETREVSPYIKYQTRGHRQGVHYVGDGSGFNKYGKIWANDSLSTDRFPDFTFDDHGGFPSAEVESIAAFQFLRGFQQLKFENIKAIDGLLVSQSENREQLWDSSLAVAKKTVNVLGTIAGVPPINPVEKGAAEEMETAFVQLFRPVSNFRVFPKFMTIIKTLQGMWELQGVAEQYTRALQETWTKSFLPAQEIFYTPGEVAFLEPALTDFSSEPSTLATVPLLKHFVKTETGVINGAFLHHQSVEGETTFVDLLRYYDKYLDTQRLIIQELLANVQLYLGVTYRDDVGKLGQLSRGRLYNSADGEGGINPSNQGLLSELHYLNIAKNPDVSSAQTDTYGLLGHKYGESANADLYSDESVPLARLNKEQNLTSYGVPYYTGRYKRLSASNLGLDISQSEAFDSSGKLVAEMARGMMQMNGGEDKSTVLETARSMVSTILILDHLMNIIAAQQSFIQSRYGLYSPGDVTEQPTLSCGSSQRSTTTPPEPTQTPDNTCIRAAQNYPMHRYDSKNTGYNSEASGPQNGQAPSIEWRKSLGNSEAGWQRPLISSGKLFTAFDGVVYALDPCSGEELWESQVPNQMWPLTIEDDRIYTVTTDNSIVCLNAESGDKLAQTGLGGLPGCYPSVHNGFVFMRTLGGKLLGFNSDLETVWEAEGESSFRLKNTVPIDGDRVYLGGRDILNVLHISTGETVWAERVSHFTNSSPTVSLTDGKVYSATSERLAAYDAETGDKVSENVFSGYPKTPPIIAGQRIFIGDQGGVRELKRDSMERVEDYYVTCPHHPSINVTENSIYISDSCSGEVFAFDRTTKQQAWSLTLEAEYVGLLAAGGHLYAGLDSGEMVCLK